MSYGTPSRRAGNLLIVLSVLLPLCIAGWLVWRSAHSSADEKKETPELKPGPSASGESGQDRSGKPEESPQSAPSEKDGKEGDKDDQKGYPLKGMTVVLDPGHNPNNRKHPDKINQLVDIGTNKKACDTTGTETNSGYAEASFTLDLARRIRTDLEKRGATVKLTQDGKRSYGPCVDERAEIGNTAKADAAISLHADGAAQGGHGFHVILPASVREGDADTTLIAGPSRHLGTSLAKAFHEVSGARISNYIGTKDGLVTRDDLGGLNLSRVPKVFLECGNMRDAQEAAHFTDPKWRGRAADGISEGISNFLTKKAKS